MYKIKYEDDGSKAFKIYLSVLVFISIIMIGVGIFLNNIFTLGLAAFILAACGIMLLMNNIKSKDWIWFWIKKSMAVVLGMLSVLLIVMTIILSQAGFTFDFPAKLPEKGARYSYATDAEVYTGTVISDSLVKIESWERNPLDSTLKKLSDIGEYRIDEADDHVIWLDKECVAFVLPDETDAKENPYGRVFNLDLKDDKGYLLSGYNENYSCFTYLSDERHMYRAIFLSDRCIKIECHTKEKAEEGFSFAYDVCTFNIKKNSLRFKWADTFCTTFSVKMNDSKNPEWSEVKKVIFDEDAITTTQNLKDYIRTIY